MTNPVSTSSATRRAASCPSTPSRARPRSARPRSRTYVNEALERTGRLAEVLPLQFVDRLGLAGRTEAFFGIHAPETPEEKDVARRRLAFDELLRLQLVLVLKKRAVAAETPGIAHVLTPPAGGPGLVDEFLERLPFRLTAAQHGRSRTWRPTSPPPHPMHRLLQGDVGAGQDDRGPGDAPLRRPGRPPGSAHGPDRGPRRAALPRRPGLPRRAAGAGPRPHRWGAAPRRRPPHEPYHGRRAHEDPGRARGREPGPGGGHPRPFDRRHPFPLARGSGHRRAAPLRGRAAGGAAGEGPAAAAGASRARTTPRPGRPRPTRVPGTPTCS